MFLNGILFDGIIYLALFLYLFFLNNEDNAGGWFSSRNNAYTPHYLRCLKGFTTSRSPITGNCVSNKMKKVFYHSRRRSSSVNYFRAGKSIINLARSAAYQMTADQVRVKFLPFGTVRGFLIHRNRGSGKTLIFPLPSATDSSSFLIPSFRK